MTDVATTEPSSQRAGDSWAWRREDLSTDYPATAWNLVYAFKNATIGFEIAAAASGDYFAVAVAGDVTAVYTSGTYAWQARVVNILASTTRHTIDEGTLVILPSFFTVTPATALDARSFSRKMLDQAEAALLAATAATSALARGIKSYTIGTRSMEYRESTQEELAALRADRDRWRLAVAREDQKEGRPNNIGRTHYARFGRAA